MSYKRRGDYALGTPIRNGQFWLFLSGFINQEMYTYGSTWAKFGSKCTQNGSELKTREPFFSLSNLGEGGPIISYGGVGFHCSKGAGAGPIPCPRRPTERFLYSGRIGVHWRPKVSVLRDDRSLAKFSKFSVRIGSELGHFLRPFLYAPGLEFHQDSPPSCYKFNERPHSHHISSELYKQGFVEKVKSVMTFFRVLADRF
jgi:hypothetical protein